MTTKNDTNPTRITQELLRQWNACYYREANGQAKMDALFAGRQALTPQEVVETVVSNADKIWVLTKALADRDLWLCYDFCLWLARERLADVHPSDRDRVAAVIDSAAAAYAAYAAAYAPAPAARADAADAAYAAGAAGISKLVSMLESAS